MSATAEMEIRISGGRIVRAETWTNGTCRLTIEVEVGGEQKEVPSKTPADPIEVKHEGESTDVTSKDMSSDHVVGGYGPGGSGMDDFDEWDQTGCLDGD